MTFICNACWAFIPCPDTCLPKTPSWTSARRTYPNANQGLDVCNNCFRGRGQLSGWTNVRSHVVSRHRPMRVRSCPPRTATAKRDVRGDMDCMCICCIGILWITSSVCQNCIYTFLYDTIRYEMLF